MTKLSAMGRRMLVLFILFLLFCGYLVYWLYDVQIKRHDELYQKARSKYTTVKKTVGNRGEIFDLNGNLLVDCGRCRALPRNRPVPCKASGDPSPGRL